MTRTYRTTTFSCFVGIFVQAIITNLTAILFIPMMELYDLRYTHLGILVGINFTAQVTADILLSGVIDRIGFKKLVLPADLLAFGGLILFALSPSLFPNHIFPALVVSTIVYAFASGLLEVLLSPIIAAIPGDNKGPAMSLMHSFYAWGQVATIILTTVALFVLGSRNWQFIALSWALIPLINFFMFLGAPFPAIIPHAHRQRVREILPHPFYLLALLAIFFGAGSEIVMNQWSSAFMEKGLHLPKLTGDLLGMCGFAAMLGLGRLLYGLLGSRLNIHKVMIYGSLLAFLCYLATGLVPGAVTGIVACALCGFAVSLLWPGTLVIASGRFPMAGAWLFAVLAVAGDVGAAVSPWITGRIIDGTMNSALVAWGAGLLRVTAEQSAMRLGLLLCSVFPLGSLAVHRALYVMKNKWDKSCINAPAKPQ